MMEVIALTNDVRFSDDREEIGEKECSEEVAILETLSKRLEDELRLARKENYLEEILLPHGLTLDIARRVFQMAELEPCGLRGCILYLEFEMKEDKKRISSIKCDPSIPSTFELHLTLRQAANGWKFLPQFWKKITRTTVMISADYDLHKKKLYRTQNDF